MLLHRRLLCSSGTYTGLIYRPSFNISKALVLEERLLHLCSMEIVLLKHLTFFHTNYMTSRVKLMTQGGGTQHEVNQEVFNPFLEVVRINNNNINLSIIDTLL